MGSHLISFRLIYMNIYVLYILYRAMRRQIAGRMNTLRSTTLEVVIQVRKEGFFVFVNNSFLSLFTHRRDPFKHRYIELNRLLIFL